MQWGEAPAEPSACKGRPRPAAGGTRATDLRVQSRVHRASSACFSLRTGFAGRPARREPRPPKRTASPSQADRLALPRIPPSQVSPSHMRLPWIIATVWVVAQFESGWLGLSPRSPGPMKQQGAGASKTPPQPPEHFKLNHCHGLRKDSVILAAAWRRMSNQPPLF